MHTTKNQDTKNQLPEDVFDRIWSYWEDRRALALGLSNGRRRPMEKTKKRISKVRKIWRLGYGEPDFRRAIDGCTMSDFHIENGHLDIELICRDQQHFEQFLFRASQHRSSGNGRTPDADTTREHILRLYG